jgi:anti-sigma factor RsiW
MSNEAEILKYLDNELSVDERKAFEAKLLREPELKQKLEDIRANRREALDAISTLNPPSPVNTPDFGNIQNTGKKRKMLSYRWLRAAAAILILAAASIAYFLIPDNNSENTMTASKTELPMVEEPEYCSELDYYISPNRCWNKRELVWTVVELNNEN